jgi:acyl carrier protein
MNTMEKLNALFRRVFNNDSIELTPQTTANDVDGWDSLSHMNLILAIEVEFQVEFSQKEAFGFQNVGELATCIDQKLAKPG